MQPARNRYRSIFLGAMLIGTPVPGSPSSYLSGQAPQELVTPIPNSAAGRPGTANRPNNESGGRNGGSSALPAVAAGIVALVAINQLLNRETEQSPEEPDGQGQTSEDRLDDLSGGGPEFPETFNMSAFVVRGPVKGNWPLVLDYEQQQPGRVEIRVSARGVPSIFRFPLPELAAGRHLIKFTLPAELGPDLKPAVVAVSAIAGSGDTATLADFSVYGLGAGPEAVGSIAIDQLGFGPRTIRVSREEAARYRFFSHSDFDTVSVEFLGLERAQDGSRHRFVGRHFLAEGVRPDEWVGLDELREWNGRDERDGVSLGSHRLQVRAWDAAGDWVCAWSPAAVEVWE